MTGTQTICEGAPLLGIVFYSTIAAGLGSLLPITLRSGMGTAGIRFSLGYATMVISVYVAHVLMGIPLRVTIAGVATLSMAGFLVQIRQHRDWSEWQALLPNPAVLLTILGGTIVFVNGGIGYLPFTHDEFSHWLATPRMIHLSGSWAAVVDFLHLGFYTPGWQLTLTLPWQVLGKEDFGLSAAAPFILHVTAIALIYDIAVFQLRQRINMTQSMAMLLSWVFILLFLAAEAMGRLWTYTLLIEQPQIYSYTTVLILIFAAEATGQDRKTLYGAAGTVLASAYLYKVAALIFVPAVLGLSCVLFFDRVKSVAGRLKGFLLTAGLLAGPLLVTVISWSAAVDANNCSPFSLSAEQMAEAASLDWKDLAVRFGSAVGSYIIGYKFILTLTVGFGVIGAFATGKYRAMLVLTLLSCAYFMLLYVFHLTCFGPYYFENLNSVSRFTRVPLQMFHALGLVMLLDTALSLVANGNWIALGGPAQLRRSWIVGSLIVIVVLLMGWQVRMTLNSVVDTTTRAYQNIDPRIAEMRTAAKRIKSLRGISLPEKPILTILSQGGDSAVVSYAQFYAMGYRNGKPDPLFNVSRAISWSPEPGNVWQTKGSDDEVAELLSQADIIWPINLDPWLLKVLGRLIPDSLCLSALPNKALVRDTASENSVRFRCIEKQEPATIKKLSEP